jgi:gamma-aminobutyric acid type B receptor
MLPDLACTSYMRVSMGITALSFLSLGCAAASSSEKKQIWLAGTFPIGGSEGWQGGQACLPATQLAREDINRNTDILRDYHINLEDRDDECDSGLGAYRLYQLIYQEKNQKVILISGCSTVCTTLAEAANQWNLVTVCYGASSPALSNRERFPTLFRTHPSATVHNPTRVNVFQRYKWTRISVIQEAEEVFVTTLDDLEKEAKKQNIKIVNRQIFKDNPEAVVRNLKHQDARIIVGLFYAKTARKVLCEIYKNKMFGPKHVWFFIGWYEDDWFMDQEYLTEEAIECTQDQMIEAAQGHFTTEALMWNQNRKEETYSGRTVDQFERALREKMTQDPIHGKKYKDMFNKNKTPEGFLEAPLAYDAVWAIALALNSSAAFLETQNQSLDSYNYDNKAVADIIQDNMEKVKFNGISGSVAFSEATGDRMAWTMIEQLVDTKYTVVGYYDQRTDNLTWNTNPNTGNELVWWPKGKIPQDRTIIKSDIKTVALTIYIPMVIVSVIGIILALILIIINNKFNYRRIIQHSHPSCNNLILTGTILCLLATIPLGINTRWIPDGLFPTFCAAPKWLLHIGFSLGYGSMFTKIWRVHRIATHTKTKGEDKIKTQVVPWKLWSMVGCLVAVDVLFVTIWQIVDPLKKKITAFDTIPSDNLDEDVEYQPEIWVCRSDYHNVWLGLTYGYKGLLLILGLFLAYETRSVKVKQINDSRLVGMSIYNVAILCIITAPVTMVIADQQNATFAFVALANVFCCYLSMALVFVPKVVFIVQHPGHDPREREDEDEKKKQEQEMKLKKILKENEELQKSIADKDRKIELLRKHIAIKKEVAEREAKEAERLAVDSARGVANNGNCRLRTSIDVKRTESLRGITVFRGQIPGSCSSKDTLESYL